MKNIIIIFFMSVFQRILKIHDKKTNVCKNDDNITIIVNNKSINNRVIPNKFINKNIINLFKAMETMNNIT